jgi:hypothetical protein
VEKLAIDHEDVVAVPDCGHIVPPLSPAGRAVPDLLTHQGLLPH